VIFPGVLTVINLFENIPLFAKDMPLHEEKELVSDLLEFFRIADEGEIFGFKSIWIILNTNPGSNRCRQFCQLKALIGCG